MAVGMACPWLDARTSKAAPAGTAATKPTSSGHPRNLGDNSSPLSRSMRRSMVSAIAVPVFPLGPAVDRDGAIF